VAKAIRDMVVRGAPAIGCAAAFGVVLGKGSKVAHQVLAKSRPTAVNLFWALERMSRAKDLEAEAKAIYDEDIVANRTLGEFGAVSIVSGRIEGETQTLPLFVQARFENFDATGAYTAAVVLALLAFATLVLMNLLTRRTRADTVA